MDTHSRRARRRLILWTAIRSTLTTACLLSAYFAAPLTEPFTAATAVGLGVALAILGVLVAWQAHAIVCSLSPTLRAIESLATSIPLFLIVFAVGYCLMADNGPNSFSEPMTHLDALYFTVTVFSTVGFGDIVPRSQTARTLTTVQMIADLLVIGAVAKVFLEATRRGIERRDQATDKDS
ncbi:potassium channel family protein [Spirillospora sp. CA-142024]|uniref:potassium channel family protein n=1 Tax=Spirillospora sp. CA-142024 TaxID=3240036 RepID=UPI003D8BDFA8